MILLDGIFVIQLLLIYGKQRKTLPNDQIFGKPLIVDDVRRDMTLLENQIPFFVVQRLFKMAFEKHWRGMPKLLELVCQFFKTVMRMEKLPESKESEVKHFVHAISLSFLRSVRKGQDRCYRKIKFTPSATELVAAGVELRRRENNRLFDIQFENGVLEIPYLVLEDSTEFYFRNIMAFEQCYCENTYLTDYMVFMHHLVDTPGDAELLIDKEIIENCLSNKEAAARVINNFGKENPVTPKFYFNSLSHELTKHCQRPCNKWKATFKRDYCSSPWAIISVIAAVVLLLLTVAQTVCSVLSLK
ncbi:hypothetical protein EUGRSUZ_B00104 [Eucalyptus grandis]|uniref:Uncharacterized protein n=2 Tax=Eucalyptus grandis TaxID=71139 RepID=A0A059CY48_EUCGR|nr:hypothetical protein EUGRSUZ_B00104 [Eucalyptus grandis]